MPRVTRVWGRPLAIPLSGSGDVVGIGNDRPCVAVEVRPDPGIVGVDGRGHGGCILETYGIEHVSVQFNRLDWVFHMREFGGV